MFYRLVVGLIAAVSLFVVAVPALAGPPETTTTTQKNLVETFVDVLTTCEPGAPLYNITTTSNLVQHETVFADGRFHGTFTQTGKVVAVPLNPSLPSYTGRFTAWGNFNQNGTTVNSTFTFSLSLRGSDGSKVTEHEVDHSNQRPDGSVNEFFHCH